MIESLTLERLRKFAIDPTFPLLLTPDEAAAILKEFADARLLLAAIVKQNGGRLKLKDVAVMDIAPGDTLVKWRDTFEQVTVFDLLKMKNSDRVGG
jgi:hypothetical protein